MAERPHLSDAVVVITGGLGQLGRQYGLAVAENGGHAVLLDIAAAVENTKPPTAPPAGAISVVAGDVTERGSLEAALATIVRDAGVPTGLVNNAAIDSPPGAPAEENGPFETYPLASWRRVLDVNATGTFLSCQVFGGAMADAGRGSVVNVSSIYGVVSPDQRLYAHRRQRGEEFFKPAAYAVSKSAVMNLTRYLATYWAPRGVRVNTLTPGGVLRDQDDEFLAAYASRVPLGRMAHESDYNGAIVFLLSEASAYMTGANLVVDGGWTAW